MADEKPPKLFRLIDKRRQLPSGPPGHPSVIEQMKLWFPCEGRCETHARHLQEVEKAMEPLMGVLFEALGGPPFAIMGYAMIIAGVQGILNSAQQFGRLGLDEEKALEAAIHDIVRMGFLAISRPSGPTVS